MSNLFLGVLGDLCGDQVGDSLAGFRRDPHGPRIEEGIVAKEKDLSFGCQHFEVVQGRQAGGKSSFIPAIHHFSYLPAVPLEGKGQWSLVEPVPAIALDLDALVGHLCSPSEDHRTLLSL
jgi:hypothetical protein